MPSPKFTCPICLNGPMPLSDTQLLGCEHRFCGNCLAHCKTTLCPAPGCSAVRRLDLIVDEVEASERELARSSTGSIRGVFGGPTMLRLEEGQKCEAPVGYLRCANVARMTLADCRHRVCIDCLSKRIFWANNADEIAICPINRCGNALTRSEVLRVAQKSMSVQKAAQQLAKKLTEKSAEYPVREDEIPIYCSVHHSESGLKQINVPKFATLSDVFNALLQVHSLRHQMAQQKMKPVSVFIRTESEGKVRYEHINVKKQPNKPISQITSIHEKSHLVLDPHNEIPK